jgi:hypothetical protein
MCCYPSLSSGNRTLHIFILFLSAATLLPVEGIEPCTLIQFLRAAPLPPVAESNPAPFIQSLSAAPLPPVAGIQPCTFHTVFKCCSPSPSSKWQESNPASFILCVNEELNLAYFCTKIRPNLKKNNSHSKLLISVKCMKINCSKKRIPRIFRNQ